MLKANYAFKKASRALDPYIRSHIHTLRYTQTHNCSTFNSIYNCYKQHVLLRRMCIILIRKTFYKYQLPKWNGAITDTFYIAQGNYVPWILLQFTINFYSISLQCCTWKLIINYVFIYTVILPLGVLIYYIYSFKSKVQIIIFSFAFKQYFKSFRIILHVIVINYCQQHNKRTAHVLAFCRECL